MGGVRSRGRKLLSETWEEPRGRVGEDGGPTLGLRRRRLLLGGAAGSASSWTVAGGEEEECTQRREYWLWRDREC